MNYSRSVCPHHTVASMSIRETYPGPLTPGSETRSAARVKRKPQSKCKGKGQGKGKHSASPESGPTHSIWMVPVWDTWSLNYGATVTPPLIATPLSSHLDGLFAASGDPSVAPDWTPGDSTPDRPELGNSIGNLLSSHAFSKTELPSLVCIDPSSRACAAAPTCDEDRPTKCSSRVKKIKNQPITRVVTTLPVADVITSVSTCVVCFDEPCVVAVVPCGHLCGCLDCLQLCHVCPICTKPIQTLLRVYDAGISP